MSQRQSDRMIVSIRINLPEYGKWKLTKFIEQYPYMSLGLAALGVLVLLGLIEAASALIN